MSDERDPSDWTAAEFETAIANAMKARDMEFVTAALTLMAVVHPREAEMVLDVIKVGMALRGAE